MSSRVGLVSCSMRSEKKVESFLTEILWQSKCKGSISDGEASRNLSYTAILYGMRRTFRGIAALPLISCYQFSFFFLFFFNKEGDLIKILMHF